MLSSVAMDEMTGSELLLHVGSLAREQRSIEARILQAAVQHANNHGEDTLDPAEAALPGREQARRFGGEHRGWRSSHRPSSRPGWGCRRTPAVS